MKEKSKIYNPAINTLVLILLNIIAYFLFIRIDLTFERKYSLSNISKEIVRNIEEDIEVDVYLSDGLTMEKKKQVDDFLAILKEYKALSKNSFIINIIKINSDGKELAAIEAKVPHYFQEINKKGMMKIQNIYLGAIIKIGDYKESLTLIDPQVSYEYEITKALKSAKDTYKPNIAFVTNHQEIYLRKTNPIYDETSRGFHIEFINLDTYKELNKYDVICILGAKDSLSTNEISNLKLYLQNGGRLFIALNHAISYNIVNQKNAYLNKVGIEEMLEEYGVKVRSDFVLDRNCSVKENTESFPYRYTIHYPYYPILTNFSNNIITKNLNYMSLQFTSSMIEVPTNTFYVFEPLIRTSSLSGTRDVPFFFKDNKEWSDSDFNQSMLIVAGLLTNEENNSAIVVISNSTFLEEEFVDFTSYKDNINFFINSLEYLADDIGLIQLRNKTAKRAILKPIKDSSKTILKIVNFITPLILLLLIVLIRDYTNKRKRSNRIKNGYM